MAWNVGQFLRATAADAAESITSAAMRVALGLKEFATMNPPVPVDKGGTNATTAAGARANLSAASTSHKDSHDPNDGSDALDTAAPSELAAVQVAAVGTSHSLARADHQHQIQHGITDNHVVTVDGSPSDDEYARWTANGLEGRTASQVRSDINVEDGADVTDGDNVAAAGAVMESDTSTASMGFVIDEDDMASDLDTKVPTQQSVKAYVDASGGSGDGIGAMAMCWGN